VVNTSFKLPNPRDPLKMLCLIPLILCCLQLYFEFSMQNAPKFFYYKVLGPCVNFNFFLSINKNSLVSFPHLVTCIICYYVFQTMMSRAMLLVRLYSSNKIAKTTKIFQTQEG
jgi:hypothetical protein